MVVEKVKLAKIYLIDDHASLARQPLLPKGLARETTTMLHHGGPEVLINTCKACERQKSESFSSHRPKEATF